MDFALRNWNKNKGKGNIKFYNAKGTEITWKNGLELPLNKVSFSQGKSKQKFGLGKSNNFLNVRLVGRDYFPEVYENTNLINQLKRTKVDNPFRPGTKTSFLNLMRRIYIKEKGYDAKASLFSIFHGPGGVAKEPFKDLSFGLLDLNKAVYDIEKSVPLKGLRKKILNQAYGQLKGKSGGKLIEAIVNQQVNIAKDIKRGKYPLEGTLRQRVYKNVLETQPLGTREREFLEKSLASFSTNPKCAILIRKNPKAAADGGRIGYQTGTVSLFDCAKDGAKNFQEGKFKTTDQAQDAAKLLSGGQKILRGLMKYGVVPEAAYVAGEAIFRNILGEKPLNAIKKSIDTFTFGLTDFTSGIDAAKFGEDANRKLAVDKFRASQDKVNSIQQEILNLEALNTGSEFGYEGDQTKAVQMKKAQLEAAKKQLEQNYVSPDIVQYIDRKAENIADAEMAKSDFAKASLKDQMDGIPGVADYMDTETARVFPRQPSQAELNLNMFPSPPTIAILDPEKGIQYKNLSESSFEDVQNYRQLLKDFDVEPPSSKIFLEKRDQLRGMLPSEVAEDFGAEQAYGASGTFFGQPLAGGGIAKIAGIDQGPPPESGPNSQGLKGLFKRAKNI